MCRYQHEVDDAVKLNRLVGCVCAGCDSYSSPKCVIKERGFRQRNRYKSQFSVTRVEECRRLVVEEDPTTAATSFLTFVNGLV